MRVLPHIRPFYRIQGDTQRRPEGIYDKVRYGAGDVSIQIRRVDCLAKNLEGPQVRRAGPVLRQGGSTRCAELGAFQVDALDSVGGAHDAAVVGAMAESQGVA